MARSRFLRYTTENVRHRAHQRVGIRFTLLAALLVTAGCMMLTERALAQQAPVTLGGVASSRQEVPPLEVSGAGGLGVFTVNAERTEMSYEFTFTGTFTSVPPASTDRRYFSCVRQIRWHRYRHLQVLEPVRVSRGGDSAGG